MATALNEVGKNGEAFALQAAKNLDDRIQDEMRGARASSAAARAAEREARQAKGETLRDTVNISDAARSIADSYSQDVPDADAAPALSMSAVTAFGTKITLEGHSTSSGAFIMGGLRDDATQRKGMFQMSQTGQGAASANMEYTLSFVGSEGKVESYKLDGNTLFTVLDDGTIRRAPVTGDRRNLEGSEGQDILIGIEDGSLLNGGGGDDIIFSAGLDSVVNGGEGNDVITSMGEGAKLDGGLGDDMLTLLQDTLRPAENRTLEETEGDAPADRRADHRMRGAQSVTVQGGDGNDSIVARTELFQSKIDGGAGSDEVVIGDATASSINLGDGTDSLIARDLFHSEVLGGNGNDSIKVNDVWSSSIDGGDGDDLILGRDAYNSGISGGAGNDVMVWRNVTDSTLSGGDGDDVIAVTGKSSNSKIYGGDGNDFIYVNQANQSIINGGAGDDIIVVNEAIDSTIDGNEGNDGILVGAAINSTIHGGTGMDAVTAELYNSVVEDEDGDTNVSLSYAENSSIKTGTGTAHVVIGNGKGNVVDVRDSEQSTVWIGGKDGRNNQVKLGRESSVNYYA